MLEILTCKFDFISICILQLYVCAKDLDLVPNYYVTEFFWSFMWLRNVIFL